MRPQQLTRAQLQKSIRTRLATQIFDDSASDVYGTAIYSLSDPRDAREIRYVGQTKRPRERLLQHVNTARLWLPDELPWWVPSPKLRPLYTWIRELYREDGRLPAMVISAWVPSTREARLAERTRIYECLEQRLPLLNIETQVLSGQIPLL